MQNVNLPPTLKLWRTSKMQNYSSKFKILDFTLLLCVFSFAFYAFSAFADERTNRIAELQRKIEELERQAEEYQGNIAEKHEEVNTLKRQVDILNSQIRSLEAEIDATENRITYAGIQVTELEERLFETENNIDFNKKSISEIMTSIYRRDKTNLVAILLQSQTISDFASEAQQTATLNAKLNALLEELKKQKTELEKRKAEIEAKKAELEGLNRRQISQRSSISGVRSSKNKLLANTRGEEKRYQQLLDEVEREQAAFFAELKILEEGAVADGRAIVHVTATNVPPRGTKIFKNPYQSRYYLTQGYGMTAYARRGTYGGAPHNGIDQSSGCGGHIYAIGSGTVIASGFNSGFGNWVAVKHDGGGGMVSVYAHMIRGTTLSNGTPVNTDTVLGYEGSTGNSTGCHLHLSLYRDFFTYMNSKKEQLYFNYFEGSVNPMDYVNK